VPSASALNPDNNFEYEISYEGMPVLIYLDHLLWDNTKYLRICAEEWVVALEQCIY
jgi:hypothetical protein